MPSRRYTILIADRTSGVVRRVTISARPAVVVACALVTLPVLVGIGAAWKAKSEVSSLYASNQSLEAENSNYRGATKALSDQIEVLESVVSDLGAGAALDPSLARAMEKLPAFVKNRGKASPRGDEVFALPSTGSGPVERGVAWSPGGSVKPGTLGAVRVSIVCWPALEAW